MLATIERFLRRRGYTHPDVRRLVALQIVLAAVASALALAVCGAGSCGNLGWSVAAGALLATVNFASLARFAQHLPYVQQGAVAALLIRFYGRLALTGLALAGCIILGRASVAGLLAGLSTVLVTGTYWGLSTCRSRLGGDNVKEA